MVSQNAGQLGAHDKTGDGQVKLYKPVHHKPPSGRGYEGADPWSSTPLHAPYEPSFITIPGFPGRRPRCPAADGCGRGFARTAG